MERIEITQSRSLIGSQQRQRRTLRSLGLRRIHQTVSQPDRPEIRGMIATVAHLVEVRYAGEEESLAIEPGQEPKGLGNPPAGSSVEDEEAADLREAEEAALAVPGTAAAADLVQHAPSLTSTDAPDAPKAPQGETDEEAADEVAIRATETFDGPDEEQQA